MNFDLKKLKVIIQPNYDHHYNVLDKLSMYADNHLSFAIFVSTG